MDIIECMEYRDDPANYNWNNVDQNETPYPESGGFISRNRAIEILADHGFEHSTFDHEIDIKDQYQLMEVLWWLGYCCRYC